MKPLENRTWYVLLSMAASALLMLVLWKASALAINLSTGAIFLFATLGLWQALSKLLALLIIKAIPSLGAVK